ncbi:glycerophosphoryl diester phosphodiesterase membrane domain-containing protein [Streptomyces fragilis]|uniref:Glycerophosphoryl diester phosphodiesterase membrane domain-containing protein n=1 Tax=Streptomyces fragilis TaxID=67301 RepID=A0ABV2YDX3_9ACTN|nr:glycerophosphoryl diester phosphodiesterase membrane domain-containing protein [Streptomyces fragilis]
MNDSPGWTSPGSSPAGGPSGEQGPQWSKEQPPPAAPQPGPGVPHQGGPYQDAPPQGGAHPGAPQHGAPYGGGPYGGAPPGGAPYGGAPHGPPGPAWGPPPAPKPGVVPLRPLGLGEILDGAVATMRTYWRPVLGISFVVALITQGLSLLSTLSVLDELNTFSSDPTSVDSSDFAGLMAATGAVYLVAMVVMLLGTTAAAALLTPVISQAVLGRPATVGQAWRTSKPQFFRLVGLTLLIPVILIAVVLGCLLPGILLLAADARPAGILLLVLGSLACLPLLTWLNFKWSLASPALILEKQPVFRSMSRSAKLVKGSWWRIFGIQLLASIIAGMLAFMVQVPFEVLGMILDGFSPDTYFSGGLDSFGAVYYILNSIGGVIAQTITLPFAAGVTVLLYIDRRIRREALDLELARVTGLAPGTGS